MHVMSTDMRQCGVKWVNVTCFVGSTDRVTHFSIFDHDGCDSDNILCLRFKSSNCTVQIFSSEGLQIRFITVVRYLEMVFMAW